MADIVCIFVVKYYKQFYQINTYSLIYIDLLNWSKDLDRSRSRYQGINPILGYEI